MRQEPHPVISVLARAKTRLSVHGWVKEGNRLTSGYTLKQAILGRTGTPSGTELEAFDLVKRHLKVDDLDAWNMQPERFKDEVVEVAYAVADAFFLSLSREQDKLGPPKERSPEELAAIRLHRKSLIDRIKALDRP